MECIAILSAKLAFKKRSKNWEMGLFIKLGLKQGTPISTLL
jgi:hypothetical protein